MRNTKVIPLLKDSGIRNTCLSFGFVKLGIEHKLDTLQRIIYHEYVKLQWAFKLYILQTNMLYTSYIHVCTLYTSIFE